MSLTDSEALVVLLGFRGSGVQGFRGSGVQGLRGSERSGPRSILQLSGDDSTSTTKLREWKRKRAKGSRLPLSVLHSCLVRLTVGCGSIGGSTQL